MDSTNLISISPTQGTQNPVIEASNIIVSDSIEHENFETDSEDNSMSEGFVSGEDGFESASEPIVGDPDDETIETSEAVQKVKTEMPTMQASPNNDEEIGNPISEEKSTVMDAKETSDSLKDIKNLSLGENSEISFPEVRTLSSEGEKMDLNEKSTGTSSIEDPGISNGDLGFQQEISSEKPKSGEVGGEANGTDDSAKKDTTQLSNNPVESKQEEPVQENLIITEGQVEGYPSVKTANLGSSSLESDVANEKQDKSLDDVLSNNLAAGEDDAKKEESLSLETLDVISSKSESRFSEKEKDNPLEDNVQTSQKLEPNMESTIDKAIDEPSESDIVTQKERLNKVSMPVDSSIDDASEKIHSNGNHYTSGSASEVENDTLKTQSINDECPVESIPPADSHFKSIAAEVSQEGTDYGTLNLSGDTNPSASSEEVDAKPTVTEEPRSSQENGIRVEKSNESISQESKVAEERNTETLNSEPELVKQETINSEIPNNGKATPVPAPVDTTGSESTRQIVEGDNTEKIDGQIVTDSEEEESDDEDGDGREIFDSAALTALLRAAGATAPDGTITINSSDASRIFNVQRPAGLGSSIPSLRPAAPRGTRASPFTSSDLAVAQEPDNEIDEEEKKLQDKVQQIRVQFLRLVQRLGQSPEDTIAAQVLYRLGLAEGIRRGRQIGRASSLESARKTAMQLEASDKDDLDFSCNILVLGKSGVGKSATINSIFGEERSPINAFELSTVGVKEIIGTVDGVKIRVIDTPGLRPSVMDQSLNRKILLSVQKFTKKCPPDIVLYVDRLDSQTRDFNDLPLLKSITSILGSSIWLNAIVALTHGSSAPPDGPNGAPLSYETLVTQRSHMVQHFIRQAASDMRLMNPVALVENHPSCRKNREGQRVLPNGQTWKPHLLLICYSSKILSEANSLLKLQDQSAGKLFGFRVRSPPLPFLLSSLLQSRAHPKLPSDQGGDNVDSDIDLDDLSDSENEGEDEYEQLPPFKPLRKSQIAKLSKEQKKAYFDEYDYRVKLLQKKQWKEELKRVKETKKRAKEDRGDSGFGGDGDEYDQENGGPAALPVPLPDMALPPTFDGDNPAYRYRFLEPTSQLLARPVLDTHGWDHDCGYDGVSLEETLAIVSRFPAAFAVQITKDKKEFNIHLDSSISAKHGETGSTLAGFDIQNIGRQLAYIFRGETKFNYFKKNKTVAGFSVTFLGENVASGLKIEDQVSIGKRVSLVASTGAVRSQGDMAYGANLEARLKEKDYPIGQDQTSLGLSLMKWRGDLAIGANFQSQVSVGRNSKMSVRVGLNNKLSGQITVRTSSNDQLQLALIAILPIAANIFRNFWPGDSYMAH